MKIEVDAGVSKLLPISFIADQVARYPEAKVKHLDVNDYLWHLKKCWGGYIPETESIVFDSSVQSNIILKCVNAKFPKLNLKKEEAWRWVFLHELGHAINGQSEWSANEFAKQRILELRREREKSDIELRAAIKEYAELLIRSSVRFSPPCCR
jgi:hypothetical protein